jgi:hypothetical protein
MIHGKNINNVNNFLFYAVTFSTILFLFAILKPRCAPPGLGA